MYSRLTTRYGRAKQQIASLFSEKPGEEIHHPLYGFLHFWVFVVRSFLRNRGPLRATALAYTTLLALVPLLAVSLGVSSSLLKSDEQQTRQWIEQLIGQVAPQLGQLPGTAVEQAEAKQQMIEQIHEFIANIRSGALGVSGTVALVFIAIGLLSTMETAFNDIWGVLRGRNWISRVIHYWATITLGPLVVIVAMGTVVSGRFLDGPPGMLQRLAVSLVPFVVVSLLFGLLYQLMPNTRVKWKAAMLGAVVAATLWILNSNCSVVFASRVVSASSMYGSLAVIPVFLIGIYISWIILLFGAQVAYAYQHRHAYVREKRNEGMCARGREFVAMRMMVVVAERFQQGAPPVSLSELADGLEVSPRLVTQLMEPLCQTRLLVEVNAPNPGYAPARPLESIRLEDILEAVRSEGHPEVPTRPGKSREILYGVYGEVRQAELRAAALITLRDLLERNDRIASLAPRGGSTSLPP
jgi:membrane protein